MSGLCHSVVAGTQKLSGYSDTIIDEVIDGADVLKGLMRKYLSDREKHKQEVKHKKAEKAAQEKAEKNAPVRGKQTLKKLMDQGSQLTNIEVTDNNISPFCAFIIWQPL